MFSVSYCLNVNISPVLDSTPTRNILLLNSLNQNGSKTQIQVSPLPFNAQTLPHVAITFTGTLKERTSQKHHFFKM
jgi:hypothetical protein